MVNFFRSIAGEEPLESDALTDETFRFANGIQNHLIIESVPGRRSGGRGRERGWRCITDASKEEARQVLAQLLTSETEE